MIVQHYGAGWVLHLQVECNVVLWICGHCLVSSLENFLWTFSVPWVRSAYRWLSLYALLLSAVLFQCHEENQCPICANGRSCCAWAISVTCSTILTQSCHFLLLHCAQF
jgi:hypothetical protein